MPPSLRHQRILARLFVILHHYLSAHGLEELLWSPADISFDAHTLVQPDLFVADFGPVNQQARWSDLRQLFLVIEGVSPSSATFDRGRKRARYQEAGVPEYWIVDGDQRHVEIWTPDAQAPVIERERLVWQHPALDDECVIDLVRLFDFG